MSCAYLAPHSNSRSAIGVTRQTIAAIEAGKFSPPHEAAFRIADVFGMPLDAVFEWEATAAGRTHQRACVPPKHQARRGVEVLLG